MELTIHLCFNLRGKDDNGRDKRRVIQAAGFKVS
jgi:hypothetical protein